MAKFERAIKRFYKRNSGVYIFCCACFWLFTSFIMLLFSLFSPLCVSTSTCTVSDLGRKDAYTDYPDTTIPSGETIDIFCLDATLIPTHTRLTCIDGEFGGIDSFQCKISQEVKEQQAAEKLAEEQQQLKSAACPIPEYKLEECKQRNTFLFETQQNLEYCRNLFSECQRAYPAYISLAQHDKETNMCKIGCIQLDVFAQCLTKTETPCKADDLCLWKGDVLGCDSLKTPQYNLAVPVGGFVDVDPEQEAALSNPACFISGSACMEMVGSCRTDENGEYYLQSSCLHGRGYWVSRNDKYMIHWDPIGSQDARICAQAGRWVMVEKDDLLAAITCDVLARQRSFDDAPLYDFGNPNNRPDYDADITNQIENSEARTRLAWNKPVCNNEAQQNLLPQPYIHLNLCACNRRFCSDRGEATINPAYPETSTVRCLCTCDTPKYAGERCDKIRCIARTNEVPNPHPNGVCREGEYFFPGESCTPQCAARFSPTSPGPFPCESDGNFAELGGGRTFTCKMTFHQCNTPDNIVDSHPESACEEGLLINELEYCTPRCDMGFEPYPNSQILCTRQGLQGSFECRRPCSPPFVAFSHSEGSCAQRRRIVSGLKCTPNCQENTYAQPSNDLLCLPDGQFDGSYVCVTGQPPAEDKSSSSSSSSSSSQITSQSNQNTDPDAFPKFFNMVQPTPDYSGQSSQINNNTQSCPHGLTNFPSCNIQTKCLPQTNDVNIDTPPCTEGRVVRYQCTPQCKTGYQPNIPVMKCVDNQLIPPQFECIEKFPPICDYMVYTFFGIFGLVVLTGICLMYVGDWSPGGQEEKERMKNSGYSKSGRFNIHDQMKNYNHYYATDVYQEYEDPYHERRSQMSQSGSGNILSRSLNSATGAAGNLMESVAGKPLDEIYNQMEQDILNKNKKQVKRKKRKIGKDIMSMNNDLNGLNDTKRAKEIAKIRQEGSEIDPITQRQLKIQEALSSDGQPMSLAPSIDPNVANDQLKIDNTNVLDYYVPDSQMAAYLEEKRRRRGAAIEAGIEEDKDDEDSDEDQEEDDDYFQQDEFGQASGGGPLAITDGTTGLKGSPGSTASKKKKKKKTQSPGKSDTMSISSYGTPSIASYISYDPQEGLRSPLGYLLQKWKPPRPGYICDGCEEEQPADVNLFASREESYHLCQTCVMRMVRGFGTPKDLRLQEEARLDALNEQIKENEQRKKRQIELIEQKNRELGLARYEYNEVSGRTIEVDSGPRSIAGQGFSDYVKQSPHERMMRQAQERRKKEEQEEVRRKKREKMMINNKNSNEIMPNTIGSPQDQEDTNNEGDNSKKKKKKSKDGDSDNDNDSEDNDKDKDNASDSDISNISIDSEGNAKPKPKKKAKAKAAPPIVKKIEPTMGRGGEKIHVVNCNLVVH